MAGTDSNNLRRAIMLTVAVLAVIVAAFMILTHYYTGDTIRKGISIEETDVSWLSAEAARARVTARLMESLPDRKLTLTYGQRKWEVDLDEIEYTFRVDDAVDQAYNAGREGSIFSKLYNSILISRNGQRFEVEESFNRERLRRIIESIKKECDSTAKNAEMTYNNGKFTFTRERIYRNLDIDRSLELAENHLLNRDFGEVGLVVEERKPEITYDKIKVIDSVLSTYSTKFNKSDINRTDNIKLACSRINNKLLMPGETFSMNSMLGPRTHENGYKQAPIIFKNELVPGTGGGVCQVSSTLYNSVLLAGLDVTEREHHSMTLSYISPGRDATITEDSIDFKFVNNLDHPVCISAKVSGNTLSISILGKKSSDGVEIKLRTKTIGVYKPKPEKIVMDQSLQAGQKVIEQKPKNGIRVVLYREAYKDGKLQWSEKLTEDYYRPIQGIIRVSSDLYHQYLVLNMANMRNAGNTANTQ
jgi:vancomycin resistance protein YoaR